MHAIICTSADDRARAHTRSTSAEEVREMGN
uniref:Uncharacterized protein n=1 Tax=Arundo donax TaxID=35708 RepID=A0A0A9BXB1_ARUDO